MKMGLKKREMINYRNYEFTWKEYVKYGGIGIGALFFLGYIFYESKVISICAIPSLYFYFKYLKKQLAKKRREELLLEFREMCMSFAAQLSAGYSFENALKETLKEMNKMYGEDCDIGKELHFMIEKLRINITIENAMMDLAVRSELEDIRLFAEVLGIAKTGGGDLIAIVKSTAMGISEKIDTDREIQLILSEKKFEQGIMNLIPLIMILYIKITSPDLMEIMYDSLIGRVIMTGCLLVYGIAFYVGRKMVEIEMG